MREYPVGDARVQRPLVGIVVTHRRPETVLATVHAIREQTLPPDRMVVVDNEPVDAQSTESSLRAIWPGISYLPVESNLGPAGGFLRGVQFALDLLEKSDGLIVLFDDDDPPVKNDSLEVLVDLFGTMSSSDPATGGVGLVGGQLRGRFPVRLHNLAPYSDLEGIIKVDWINGGYLPIYSRSIFDAGARFNERLFFGYEELDFGLTARRLGFSLYSSGDIWQQHSELYGKAAARARRRAAADRLDFSVLDAYKTRNLVWTLKVNGFRLSAYYYSIRRLVSKVVMRQPSQSYRAVRWTWLALRAGLRGDRLAPQDLDLGR